MLATLIGMKNYHGIMPLQPSAKVTLVAEPNNKYDKEAVKVTMDNLGTVGYIANNVTTVITGSNSARIVQKMILEQGSVEGIVRIVCDDAKRVIVEIPDLR